jgi:DNA-binding PucR family transcriptional regulator
VTAAEGHSWLAETVCTYISGRYSTTACARALNLHPNSVRYRLQRWSELTDWDL